MPQKRSVALAAAVLALMAASPSLAADGLLRVGAVSRHADRYLGHGVKISGFVLAQEDGYALVSDEPGGRIGHFDLPVIGDVSSLKARSRYIFEGTLVSSGLKAVNGNPVHLELTAEPLPSKR